LKSAGKIQSWIDMVRPTHVLRPRGSPKHRALAYRSHRRAALKRPRKKRPNGKLEKIPQPGKFNYVFSGRDGANQGWLWSGVDLIQMMLRCGLGHELPYAFVKGALNDMIGARVADAFIIE
jgi:hypothetical protein